MGNKRYCMPDPSSVLTDEIILREIPTGSRVLDLGCGSGRLLATLRDQHDCVVQGVELDTGETIEAIRRGIPIINDDIDAGLQYFPEDCFDFAVVSQTLQQLRRPLEVLDQVLRIANKVLVIIPNFAHWKVRWQVLIHGRAPVTTELPYEWYNSPNLHFMSMHDFRDLQKAGSFHIVKELPIIGNQSVNRAWMANIRAKSVLYILERTELHTQASAQSPVS